MILKTLLGSCCQSRDSEGKCPSNFEVQKLIKENGKGEISIEKMKNYSLSTQSGNNNANDIVDSEHEIFVSRSERVEKLVMSKKIENKDLFDIPMTSSQRFKYGRSASDYENKSIVIDNPSFCENKEFFREVKHETETQGKNLPRAEEGDKKQKRQIKMWTEEEDELLKKYYDLLGNKWDDIATKIPGRNASQCSQRWRRRYKPEKVRKPWTKEEDQLLLNLLKKYGTNWHQIASQMKGNRTGKQVRERYINKLDPDINKTNWEEEEDKLIFSYFNQFGPKWSEISKLLRGRPENMVKNRFYSHIKKKYGVSKPRSQRSNKNSETNSQNLISENGYEQEFFEDDSEIDFENSGNCSDSNDFDSESDLDDLSKKNQTLSPGNSVIDRHGKKKLTLDLDSNLQIITEQAGETSSIHATRSSFDNQSRIFFRNGMSSSTTFKTEEGGVSLYPQEIRDKEHMGNSSWNLDNSVDDLGKKFPSNVFAPEKIGLQQLLRHGTSIMSEELCDFTPLPKLENNEEIQGKLENHELLLDEYLNIDGERPKEIPNLIDSTSNNSNVNQNSTSSSNINRSGSRVLQKSIKSDLSMDPENMTQSDIEKYKAELLRKLAEVDTILQLKKEKDSDIENLKK